MDEPEARAPAPDDTAAFQRFYTSGHSDRSGERSLLYRIFVGWWRDRS